MSESCSIKDTFKFIIDIFSKAVTKMGDTFDFSNSGLSKSTLYTKYKNEINFGKEENISFDTDDLYLYIIKKIHTELGTGNKVDFHSAYSVLYLKRIIYYLEELTKKDLDIYKDILIKLFFYLFFVFFEENITKIPDSGQKILELDVTFLKGTFIELKKKYSSIVSYKDSKEITEMISNRKKTMNNLIISRLSTTFQDIIGIINEFRNPKDNLMKGMKEDVEGILQEISILSNKNDISIELINKLNKFYSNKNYLTFTNYISEKELYELDYDIDEKFLSKIQKEYSYIKYDYLDNNSTINDNNEKKLNLYLKQRNTNYKRMTFSWFPEIFKLGLDDESTIFAITQYDIRNELKYIQEFKMKLENLEQNNMKENIKEILNDNSFYEYFFSILKCDIIKEFFHSYITVEENGKEFKVSKNKIEGSEYFGEVYSNFIKTYDKKDDNFNDFKNLIIIKILPYGDRAYTVKNIKKIAINPVQFLIGNDLNESSNIKKILKGYLIIILLHETEHFLRLLESNVIKNVFPSTPRQQEGGRLFIKYLLDVYSINHIDLEQADKILNIDTWGDHDKLKNIFYGQLEDIEKEKGENIDEFLFNNFKNSISFFSKRQKKDSKKIKISKYLKK